MKSILAILPLVGLAASIPLQVPFGLSKPINIGQYPGFNLDVNEQRLVQMEDQEPMWVTEWDKILMKALGVKFFDITETQDLESFAHLKTQSSFTFPKKPNFTEQVKAVIKTLETQEMRDNLEQFTSFRTRYYRSDTGKQSQQWLLGRIAELTAMYASDSLQKLITLKEFEHSWGQNSLIVRIQGSSDSDEVVVIGAHQDSTNMFPFLPAPGADDDGSGSTTILEAYRALISADFHPERTVEFHWYSAEEGGLLGSQAVAREYAARYVNVIAFSQFDMTAWVKSGTEEVVGVITDYVDPDLTTFNKMLVDTYLDIPYAETRCGYACSDHASWTKVGVPSIFTIESKFEDSNKHIHSISDKLDISPEFSFDHMKEFAKLAVGFAVELGGWSSE